MDLYFRRPDEWELSYNCSFYNPDSWPREDRVSKIGAFIYLFMGVLEEALYIPVVYVLLDKKLRQNFCYRLMLMMALYDMLLLPGTAFATAYFLYYGTVFCDSPKVIYFIGLWLIAGWMGYSLYAIILAFNRCVYFTKAGFLFTEYWQWIWYTLPILYTFFHFMYGIPVIFNPKYYGWFFNPHLGYFDDKEGRYINYAHIIDNLVVAIVIPFFYIVFYCFVRNLRVQQEQSSKSDKNLFFQILIVSIIMAIGCIGYFIMQIADVPNLIICTGHFNWLIVQITPAVTYLTVNQTFRKKLLYSGVVVGRTNSSANRPSNNKQRNTIEPWDGSGSNTELY